MKQKKYLLNLILALFMAIFSILPSLLQINKSIFTYAADPVVPVVIDPLEATFERLAITQANKVYSKDDFRKLPLRLSETSEGSIITTNEVDVIYVVGGLTITLINETLDIKITTITAEYKTDKDFFYINKTVSDENTNFSETTLKSSALSRLFSASTNASTLTYVKAEVTADPNATPGVPLYSHEFYIYQVKDIDYDTNGISWFNNATEIFKPAENQTYSNTIMCQINLSEFYPDGGLSTSQLNCLYIDFWFNGEPYSLRGECNGKNFKLFNNLYNYDELDASKHLLGLDLLKTYTISNDVSSPTILPLLFNQSGDYRVRIYDKTYNGTIPTSYSDNIKYDSSNNIYAESNMQEYNFTVVNNTITNGFYYTLSTATQKLDSSGNIEQGKFIYNYIVSAVDYNTFDELADNSDNIDRQVTNGTAKIAFYNLTDVSKIEIAKSYLEAKGDVSLTETAFDAQDYIYTSLPLFYSQNLTEEASYNITITYKNNKYTYIKFQLLNTVRNKYTFESTDIEYPAATDELKDNVVKTYEITQSYFATANAGDILKYNLDGIGDIYGYLKNDFDLYIATSKVSIGGVSNKQKTNEAVTITATGVASKTTNMRVIVKKDGGTILDTKYNNILENSALTANVGTFSDLGNYTVTVIDAMNNSTQIQFTITKQQNAAGIILIIIGCIVAVVAIILLIRVRSKVSVR